MKNMTLSNIAKACGGRLCGAEKQGDSERRLCGAEKQQDSERHLCGTENLCSDERIKAQEASCVVIDSRKIEPGGVFIATKGERVDGHTYIPAVTEKGALGVVCEKAPKESTIPYILVEDSFRALREIAEYYRKQLDVRVVGITGSVGKTSTKEFIAGVLSHKYRVLKTQGNFNNEIGLPLTVLSIRQEHEIAVLEMGISDFGEMHRLSRIARPDICVMTNIGQCHLENLGTREGILKAKSEIFDFISPEGHVFVNGDDDLLGMIGKKGGHVPVHFGLNPSNEIFASDVKSCSLIGSRATVHAKLKGLPMQIFPLEIPVPGGHMVSNALAAAGIGLLFGLDASEIKRGVAEVETVDGRSRVLSLPAFTLIDDCYNANPASMRAALDLLAGVPGRKVAVLGDMFELGERQEQFHREIGAYAAEKGIDILICAGKLAGNIYEGASTEGASAVGRTKAYYFETREDMMKELSGILEKGDTILVKASHGMEFERVIEFLKTEG